jgi:hypothetical protein
MRTNENETFPANDRNNGIVRKATKTAIVATLTATRYVVIPEAFKWLQSQI